MIKVMIFITIIVILLLVYFISYYKLKDITDRILFSEKNLEETLTNKANLITKINTEIKSKLEKKTYLKDYININKQNLTNIEKDIKLDEAYKLIKNLKSDIPDINTDNFKKLFKELKSNDETLIASKKLYNKYSEESNNIIRKFPNNIVAKITGKRIRAFFNV